MDQAKVATMETGMTWSFFPHTRLMKTKHFGWAIVTRLLRRLLHKKYYKTFDQALCFFFIAYTAWKVSIFGVILVLIFPHSDWIRKVMTRITPNTDTFHALFFFFIIHFILIWLYSSSNVYKYIRLIYAK